MVVLARHHKVHDVLHQPLIGAEDHGILPQTLVVNNTTGRRAGVLPVTVVELECRVE